MPTLFHRMFHLPRRRLREPCRCAEERLRAIELTPSEPDHEKEALQQEVEAANDRVRWLEANADVLGRRDR